MPSRIYRDRLRNSIENAISEARAASELNHAGLVGRVRELCAEKIIRPMLPSGFEVGTGKVCDRNGTLSPEIDLVIHCPSVLPPVMYTGRDGVFAFEACLYIIEVKSRLTSTGVADFIEKIRRYKELTTADDGHGIYPGATPVLFAFDTDLMEGSSELDRYAKHDPAWNIAPLVKVICVAGRGYWYAAGKGEGWYLYESTPDRDEVIDLVSGISNTVVMRRCDQPVVPLGQYLMLQRDATLLLRPNASV